MINDDNCLFDTPTRLATSLSGQHIPLYMTIFYSTQCRSLDGHGDGWLTLFLVRYPLALCWW